MRTIYVRRVHETFASTGFVYRAFSENDTPYYISEETREALEERLRGLFGHVELIDTEERRNGG